MAVGDIVGTQFTIDYNAKGTGTIAAGDIVAYDTDGDIIPGSLTTYGKHGILTAITHVVGASTYYGVLTRGLGICTAGGTIQPNTYVKSDSNSDAVEAPLTIGTTPTQAQIRELTRVLGKYVCKASDDHYNPSDAAATNAIVVNVGEVP